VGGVSLSKIRTKASCAISAAVSVQPRCCYNQ